MKFTELPIISPLQKALERQGFDTATEIQEKVIPIAIHDHDILGTAQTGSWKTLAFTLPTLQKLYENREGKGSPELKKKRLIRGLILAPTRELAVQIGETFAPYSSNANMKHTVIFGWVNDFHQIKAIEKWVDILIATPGRLEDLISRNLVKLSYVEMFVMDEADRMLEMWAIGNIKKILLRLPDTKQTLFFSATMPKEIIKLSDSILKDPRRVAVHTESSTTQTITQQVYHINRNYKRQLLQQISKKQNLSSILVFVNTIDESEKIFEFVKAANIKCGLLNKNKSQTGRQKALSDIKDGTIKVLVATDLASRGLDISELSCVINYEIPNDAESYVHRIGRTARAGKSGLAIAFCTPAEKDKFKAIEKLIDQEIEVMEDDSYKKVIIPQGKSDRLKKLNEKTKPRIQKWRKQYGKAATWGKKTSSEKSAKSGIDKRKSAPKKSMANSPKKTPQFANRMHKKRK